MQLFLGGACAGKRSIVRQRFASPRWHSAYAGCRLEAWPSVGVSPCCLVLEGWEHWLWAALFDEPDNERLRRRMIGELDALRDWELKHGGEVILILLEMGRGIVPLAPEARRLRDLNGWLAQDAAARCRRAWYVWNGLVKSLTH